MLHFASLKNTVDYGSCRNPLKIFELCTLFNVTKRGIPDEELCCSEQVTSQFPLLTVFLRELLALSSSANFRTYNQLYTYTKVCFH